jgi:hypothetical protein
MGVLFGIMVWGLRCMVYDLWFEVYGLWFMVYGFRALTSESSLNRTSAMTAIADGLQEAVKCDGSEAWGVRSGCAEPGVAKASRRQRRI